MNNKVFVYGTLKRSNPIRGLDRFPGATFIAETHTTESQYQMYHLGAFPAVQCGGAYNVRGEIWEVDADTFRALDAIEGYPDFYNRKIVETEHGPAWMYHFVDHTNDYDNVEPVNEVLEWN